MKRVIFSLELTIMTFFILLAFVLGVMAGWQSANSKDSSQHLTLQRPTDG